MYWTPFILFIRGPLLFSWRSWVAFPHLFEDAARRSRIFAPVGTTEVPHALSLSLGLWIPQPLRADDRSHDGWPLGSKSWPLEGRRVVCKNEETNRFIIGIYMVNESRR